MQVENVHESIAFHVAAYQFPHMKPKQSSTYDYDANWLTIEIIHRIHGRTKIYQDNCILTYELNEMICGLRQLADGALHEYASDFMEPYLEVKASKTGLTYHFLLNYTFQPFGSSSTRMLAFHTALSKDELDVVIRDLQVQASAFPERI